MKKFFPLLMAILLSACGGGGDEKQVTTAPQQQKQSAQVKQGGAVPQAADTTTNKIAGYRANYEMVVDGEKVTVTSKLDKTVQVFTTAKELEFFDKNVSFALEGPAGQIYRLYQAAFNRKPDQVGLGFWIFANQNGHDLTSIAGGFLGSDEFKRMYGDNPPAATFVDKLYQNVLHRAGEPEGFNFWLNAVNAGYDRRGILDGFAQSPENKANLLPDVKNGFDYIVFNKPGPIIPKFTSYENAKSVNASQTIPILIEPKTSITKGYALADFFGTGSQSMVAFSENGNADNAKGNHTIPGSIYFFAKENGVWVDKTVGMLADRTGCIEPRKVMVADFNSDGKPDVFASCHGVDDETGVGEQPRVLLSQKDGTYINKGLGFNCFCHGAATIDTDNTGFSDIVIADPKIAAQPIYLKNNRDGTFTKDFDRFHDEVKQYEGGFSRPIYTVEIFDINGDAKPDLVFAGSEKACCINQPLSGMPTTVYKNDGKNSFKEKLVTLPVSDEFPLVLDMVYQNGILYTSRVAYMYDGMAIAGFNIAENKQTMIYSTRSKFENGTRWFDWIIPVNGMVQPLNNTYNVSVK